MGAVLAGSAALKEEAAPEAPPAPAAPQAPETPEAPEASVGVLGWLGFFIINVAAWGIITTSSYINWFLGFVFCLGYTSLLLTGAILLGRRGLKYRQFVNLLWVLAMIFIFVLGLYISTRIVGPVVDGRGIFDEVTGGSTPWLSKSPAELEALLPSNASESLKAWARASDRSGLPTFAAFAAGAYFRGASASGEEFRSPLWRSNGSSVEKVQPELLQPESFTAFQGKLFFLADSEGADRASERGLWALDAATPSTAARAFGAGGQRQLFGLRDGGDGRLYFKASWNCPAPSYAWVSTIYSSEGAGATDLSATEPCAPRDVSGTNATAATPADDSLPVGALWGTLFLSCVPMALLSGLVVFWKQMPGPVATLLGGVLAAAVVLFLIADGTQNLASFLKWSVTSYTGALWLALLIWSLRHPELPEWQDELKTWAVAVVGVGFAVIIHVDLEIPFKQEAWRWLIYSAVTVLQIVLSMAVSRTVPMVAGAAGLFLLSWKVAYELVEFAGLASGETKTLALLALLALQGMAIVVAAVAYAGRRERVDSAVRGFLSLPFAKC